ncbi:MAG: FadR/GntR family transcriptional regulator [Bacillota bacterium]|nr:FadR/GntR family transcriptional regulator [Bacillota bacterium]
MSEYQISRGARVYEKVVEKIKRSIAEGDILPGQPLPSERQLMDSFGVSRASLREAFRVLELLGLIESVPGKGRFVRQPRAVAADDQTLPLEESAILELMEARRILDPAIAAESAMRALSADLTRLLQIVSVGADQAVGPKARARIDFDFHLALAEATHNFVFVNLTRMNFDLIMATHERIYNLLNDKDAFLLEHRAIYDAVCDHDPARAREAAAAHIDRIYKTLLLNIASN